MNKLYIHILWLLFSLVTFQAVSQDIDRSSIPITPVTGEIKLDGILDEADWGSAVLTDQFKTIEPVEGGEPSGRTTVRVLAHPKYLLIGIECFDDKPDDIVYFSKLRDSDLDDEDHVKVVIDPFLDGQSGMIFTVNAGGARYDALVSNRGESENEDWDAVWEAKTFIGDSSWTAEILIPVQSISFNKKLKQWGFNVERRIQRYQETIRWANVRRDQWFTQTSRAGLLTELPEFNYGVGLNIRPSIIGNVTKTGGEDYKFSFDPSIDISQRLGPNITATVTVNTDFAESEVDTRRTNLSRFPLFFPEKRSFFLDGADIFEFGFGLRSNIVPFFSRNIGLYDGNAVPILAGGKINGRLGKTSFGGLTMMTRNAEIEGVEIPATTMGVFRVKQNIFKESSIGIIGTLGDPHNRGGSFTTGVDFTYQTTRFQGNKNFLIGVAGMYANRNDLSGDQTAFHFKADYPNDTWDLSLTYFRIGESFDPSLGFVPRKGIHSYRVGMTYAPRPSWKWLRQMHNQLFIFGVTDLHGNWESYSIFTAPINWQLESGDKIELNYMPKGEQLAEAFEIADGVIIPAGAYHDNRYRIEIDLAAKRKISGRLSWWFGGFYGGKLQERQVSIKLNPSSMFNFEINGRHNVGSLPYGDINQKLIGFRVRFNASPDLQFNSFVQYETDSNEIGVNARIHWIFHPQGDLFLVFNHNTFNELERWQIDSQQILLKLRYNFRI